MIHPGLDPIILKDMMIALLTLHIFFKATFCLFHPGFHPGPYPGVILGVASLGFAPSHHEAFILASSWLKLPRSSQKYAKTNDFFNFILGFILARSLA